MGLAERRKEIAKGLAPAEDGRLVEGEEVFDRLFADLKRRPAASSTKPRDQDLRPTLGVATVASWMWLHRRLKLGFANSRTTSVATLRGCRRVKRLL